MNFIQHIFFKFLGKFSVSFAKETWVNNFQISFIRHLEKNTLRKKNELWKYYFFSLRFSRVEQVALRSVCFIFCGSSLKIIYITTQHVVLENKNESDKNKEFRQQRKMEKKLVMENEEEIIWCNLLSASGIIYAGFYGLEHFETDTLVYVQYFFLFKAM